MKGYQSGDDLGFPLGSEAVSFLERRCRFPAQRLSRVVPQASAEAVELLEALLAMNPSLRPSAETALGFRYLANVPPLADYSRVRIHRPPPEYFDFEMEKHTLASLKAMIAEEVVRSDGVAASQQSLTGNAREAAKPPQGGEGSTGSARTQRTGAGPSSLYARIASKAKTVREGGTSGTRSSIPRRRPSIDAAEGRGSSGGPSHGSESSSSRINEGSSRAEPHAGNDIADLERALAASRIAHGSQDKHVERSGVVSQFQSSYRSLSAQIGERALVQARSGTKPSSAAAAQPFNRAEYSSMQLSKFANLEKRSGRALPSLLRR